MSRTVPSLVGVVLALPLVAYAAVGAFARYTADDYCWAGVLRTEGFWRAQVLWYTGYSPRYAFTFLVNLAELAGPAIVPGLPVTAVLTWVAVLSWTIWQLDVRLGRLSPAVSAALLAEIATFATLHTAPDIEQSLYWQTGMLTYLLPLVLATLFVGWGARAVRLRRVGPGAVLVSGALTYIAGGLSETYLIPQNVALTLATLFAAAHWRQPAARAAVPLLAAGLLGGVLALTTILVAPSTASRVGGSPADLWLASSASIATAWFQVVRLVRFFPQIVLLCLVLPGLLGTTGSGRSKPRSFLVVSAAVAITLPFCYFPSFYAQNGNPPARSLIVPGSILIGYLIYVGVFFAPWLARVTLRLPPAARAAALCALALVPLVAAATILPERARAAQYAALWDAEDAQIRAARDGGARELVVAPLPRNLGEDFVTADPTHFFNVCVARYYGLEKISAS